MAPKSKKRSKAKSHPVRLPARLDRPEKDCPSLVYSSYEITTEPIEDSSVPDEIRDEMKELYEKSQKDPASIIDRIVELISEYPNVPKLYNFMTVAYNFLGDQEKVKYYSEMNYRKNPSYLFAKLNYAEICMSDGDLNKIPEIFEDKFDLKMLYPERNIFHITEVVGFLGIIATYFSLTGMKDQVNILFRGLEELAPYSPYTERIRQYLFAEKTKNQFNQLIGKK